jgi:hypothetical protein
MVGAQDSADRGVSRFRVAERAPEGAGVGLRVPLDTVFEEVTALGRVVDLVEDLALRRRRPRAGQADQVQDTGHGRDRQRGDPRRQAVARRRGCKPAVHLVEVRSRINGVDRLVRRPATREHGPSLRSLPS